MPEHFTPAERSRIMSRVKSSDTAPELLVRRLVHRLGYRFRLHRRDLPGRPDLTLARLRKIINVHGCFWHLHHCKHGRLAPRNNAAYWQKKREGNAARDRRTARELRRLGWDVLTIWECQTKDLEKLAARVRMFLAD